MSLRDDITKRYQKLLNEQNAHSRHDSYYTNDNTWRDKARKVMDEVRAERSGNPSSSQTSSSKPSTAKKSSTTPRRSPPTTSRSPRPQTTTRSASVRPAAPTSRPVQKNDDPQGAMSTIRRPVTQQPVNSLTTPMSNFMGRVNNAVAVAPYIRPMQQTQVPIAASQPIARPVSAIVNPTMGRSIDQTAMNPSGAFTPKAIGLNDRQAMADASTAPTLWQRVKNFFSGNPQYGSGYGNDPSQDAYAMSLQRQNAINAGSIPPQRQMFTGVGAEGQLNLLGGNRLPVATQPIRSTVSTTPVGAGAEGQSDLLGRTGSTTSATASPPAAIPARDTASSDRRARLRGYVERLPPGKTTTTTSPNGRTRTTTTTSSGTFVGDALVDDQGRAVNPEEQDQVNQANELKRKMKEAGGASGGRGITSRASTPSKTTSSTRSNYQPPTTKVRKMSQRGAGAEGEL